MFEHGGISAGNSVQSVYHAHTHLIGNLELFDLIRYFQDMLSGGLSQNEIYPYRIVPAPDHLFLVNLNYRFTGKPYFYLEQGHWGIYAEEDENHQMQSQIGQRSMSWLLNGHILNWKNIPEDDNVAREAIQRLKKLYDYCQTHP